LTLALRNDRHNQLADPDSALVISREFPLPTRYVRPIPVRQNQQAQAEAIPEPAPHSVNQEAVQPDPNDPIHQEQPAGVEVTY